MSGVINGAALLADPPIDEMFNQKIAGSLASHGLSEVGYDIRLKQDVTFYPRSRADPIGSVHLIDRDRHGAHSIEDGNFTLASAIEHFVMPDYLMGVVHDKSTWARHGLSVFNTVIEPGWRGYLTLELVYHGRKHLHIPGGTGIAQVVFTRIAQPANYVGKYQNQPDRPVQPVLAQIRETSRVVSR